MRPEAILYNDHGLRAGWRLLIFLCIIAVIAGGAQLLVKGLGLAPNPANKPPAGYAFPIFLGLGECVPFLILLFICWIMSKIERRPVREYGLPLRRPAFSRFWTGYLFWGFLPLSILLLVMRALHVFYFGGFSLHGSPILFWGLAWGFTFLVVGFFEEFFFRGYVLFTLGDGIGFWPAAIILATGFAYAHMGNGGETKVGVIATALFALFASATLRRTGSLWLAVGSHAGWDWGQSFFYGVNDSGLQAQGHLLNPHVPAGAPVWLTGGTVGPEGSVLTLILWGVMTVGFLIIYRRRSGPELVMTAEPANTLFAR
jgi:membrane protease YdiL (CAAX protease family)